MEACLRLVGSFHAKREDQQTCLGAMVLADPLVELKGNISWQAKKWRCQEVNCDFKKWVSVTTKIQMDCANNDGGCVGTN